MIRQMYYISTGAKMAMFTLRVRRINTEMNLGFSTPDNHICNLASADHIELAIEKAKAYTEAMKDRIGETENFSIEFGGVWDDAINYRRGKLSVLDTHRLEMIEAGIFPFGKHQGEKIEDAPESYVLFFADKYGHTDNVIANALAGACQGVALEKGYIAKRDQIRAERKAENMKSNYVGEIGKRQEFEGTVIMAFYKSNDWGDEYYINKVRQGDDIIVYIGGKKLGEVDENIKFKATVKAHDEYQEVKTTRVNRPMAI